METKIALVLAEVEAQQLTVTAACARLQISRQTFYKWRKRFAAAGPAGLVQRSRRPLRSPTTTPPAVVAMILAARDRLAAEGWDYGALSIHYRLVADGEQPPPARTIHRVLVRAGLISPQSQKRRRSSYRRFQFPATDDCWQLDAYEYTLSQATTVVVFELKDDCSRYLLHARAWPLEDTLGAWTCLAEAIATYGKPRMLLSDNSLAFTGRRIGQIVLVERNLIALGIKPIHAAPNHPQTCGKNERGHQTARRWLHRHPTPATLEELQTLLDHYREQFNLRPHQALAGTTPLAQRTASRRIDPSGAPTIEHPTLVSTLTANRAGAIKVARATIALGHEYRHRPITVFNTNDRLLIFYHHHLVRDITIDRTRTYQPLHRPRAQALAATTPQ